MSINFSLRKFPASGQVKGQCGLPFGCVVQPFVQLDKLPLEVPTNTLVDDLARCSECYAYINKHCHFERSGWVCSLCGNFNDYHSFMHKRYMRQPNRARLPELRDSLVELKCSTKTMMQEADEGAEHEEKMATIPDDVELVGRPVYVALVDLACGEEFLELVKSALLAALEALPPAALFGIVAFSDKIGLHNVQGKEAVVKNVVLLDEERALAKGPTPLELDDAMPLEQLLAPVGQWKDQISAELDSLQPCPSHLASGNAPGVKTPMRRGFGGAVQAVLRYLSNLTAAERVGERLQPEEVAQVAMPPGAAGGEEGKAPPPMMIGYSGARVLCFVSGAPNHGPGKVAMARVTSGGTDGPAQEPQGVMFDPSAALLGGDPTLIMPPVAPPARPSPPPQQQQQQGAEQVAVDLGSRNLEGGAGFGSNGASKGAPPEPVEIVIDSRCAEFYHEAAAAAAALSVAVDVYAVCGEESGVMGLSCLEPLASSSGGQLCWYPTAEGAALPQDVYRRLAATQARDCRLRIRTSPEFEVQRSYGHLLPDQQYENLHHIVSCGPHDCVAFDFEFASNTGFMEADECPPTIQLAFQYSTMVVRGAKTSAAAVNNDEAEGGEDGQEQKKPPETKWYVMERRMRIHTIQVAVAKGPKDLYSYADSDTILALLMHKIVRASQEEGLLEARSLLQDWLVILMAHYNMQVKAGKPSEELDVGFEACPALQPMSRLIYVLLQSPLLTPGSGDPRDMMTHPDLRCFLQNLWAQLPPRDLQRAVYPVLSSWTDPDTPAYPKHSLSRTALITSGEPIFLLDSFTHLVVYYAQGCPETLPFPPPQTSKLRQTINQLRINRVVAPQVKMLRGGIDDVSPFTSFLIEEADASAVQAGGEHIGTFVQFLEIIKGEVQAFLREQHQS